MREDLITATELRTMDTAQLIYLKKRYYDRKSTEPDPNLDESMNEILAQAELYRRGVEPCMIVARWTIKPGESEYEDVPARLHKAGYKVQIDRVEQAGYPGVIYKLVEAVLYQHGPC